MPKLTTIPLPALPFSCACGARRYATAAEASAAEPNGLYKCPGCHTFATDHNCNCSEDSDGRCFHCDIRHGSHGTRPLTATEAALLRVYGPGVAATFRA